MTHRLTRRAGVLTAAAILPLILTPVAGAHGLGAGDPNRPVPEYLWLGFKHLLAGWDHLLFILAIVLLAGGLLRATKLISLFVLGHSVTLMLSTTNEWTVNATVVDVVIALSVLFVAVIGLRGRPEKWTWFGTALFAIGLVHGLGLGTRLLELGVSDNDLVWRVLLFNVGVELGQATAVIAFVGAGMLLAKLWSSRERWRRPAFGVIATAGAIGAAVLSLPGDATQSKAVAVGAACRETQTKPPSSNDAGHPPRRFYEPDEQSPTDAFTHVKGDGYVVVTYQPDLSATDLAALRQHIESGPKVAYGGPDPEQSVPVVATTAFTTLTCTRLDLQALGTFREGWLKQMGGSIG